VLPFGVNAVAGALFSPPSKQWRKLTEIKVKRRKRNKSRLVLIKIKIMKIAHVFF